MTELLKNAKSRRRKEETSNFPWDQLRGKFCKIVLKDSGELKVWYGTVTWASDSFVVERDRHGRVHFISTSIVERIHEHTEGMENVQKTS